MSMRSIALLTLLLVPACQASAGAQMQAKSSGELGANADTKYGANVGQYRNVDGTNSASLNAADPYGPTAANTPDAMLGARAGLRLMKPSTAHCQCLGVVVGLPTDPGLTWEGPVPQTNPSTQLVVGLSSEGLPCPTAATDSLGASYRGYEISGADVIVQVETARLGRPIAQGAIVPKPTAGGRILISPSDGKSPYGRSLDGKSRVCKIWSSP